MSPLHNQALGGPRLVVNTLASGVCMILMMVKGSLKGDMDIDIHRQLP